MCGDPESGSCECIASRLPDRVVVIEKGEEKNADRNCRTHLASVYVLLGSTQEMYVLASSSRTGLLRARKSDRRSISFVDKKKS